MVFSLSKRLNSIEVQNAPVYEEIFAECNASIIDVAKRYPKYSIVIGNTPTNGSNVLYPFCPILSDSVELSRQFQRECLVRQYHNEFFRYGSMYPNIALDYPVLVSIGRTGSTKIMRDLAAVGLPCEESIRPYWPWLVENKQQTEFNWIDQFLYCAGRRLEKINPQVLRDVLHHEHESNHQGLVAEMLGDKLKVLVTRDFFDVVYSTVVAQSTGIWNTLAGEVSEKDFVRSDTAAMSYQDLQDMIEKLKQWAEGALIGLKVMAEASPDNWIVFDKDQIGSTKYLQWISSMQSQFGSLSLELPDTQNLKNLKTFDETLFEIIKNEFVEQNEEYKRIVSSLSCSAI